MTELTDFIDKMDITWRVLTEACVIRDETKRTQIVYIWNVTADSYDYVICDAEDEMPDVVILPAVKREVIWPYGEK